MAGKLATNRLSVDVHLGIATYRTGFLGRDIDLTRYRHGDLAVIGAATPTNNSAHAPDAYDFKVNH